MVHVKPPVIRPAVLSGCVCRYRLDLPVQGKVKSVMAGHTEEGPCASVKTLTFYEGQGLLPPADRTTGGYRDYSPDVVSRLGFIRRGRTAGLTLAQIRQVLEIRDGGAAPCAHVKDLLAARLDALDHQISELQTLREIVAALRETATTVDPATCSPDQVCRYV